MANEKLLIRSARMQGKGLDKRVRRVRRPQIYSEAERAVPKQAGLLFLMLLKLSHRGLHIAKAYKWLT